MSGTSAPPEAGSEPPCCEEHPGQPAPMLAEVMHIRVARVDVPVRGYRCPICRADHIRSSDARAARDYAERMGFVKA